MNQTDIPTQPIKKPALRKLDIFTLYALIFYSAFSSLSLILLAARLLLPLTAYKPTNQTVASLTVMIGLATGFFTGGFLQKRSRILAFVLTAITFFLLVSYGIVQFGLTHLPNPSLLSATLTAGIAYWIPSLLTGLATILSVHKLFEGKRNSQITPILSFVIVTAFAGAGLGILFTAYLFIPWIGITASLRGLTFFWACFALYFLNRYQKMLPVVVCLFCLLLPLPASWQGNGTILVDQIQGYSDTFSVVSDGIFLRLDSTAHTGVAQTLLGTYQPQLPYVNKMIELAGNVYEKNVLIIGGTGHMLAHIMENSGAQVTEVTADPSAAKLSDQYFQPILGQYHIQDGRTYLQNAGDAEFDVILIDADGEGAIHSHLASLEFFQAVNNHLAIDGRVVYHFNDYSDTGETTISNALSATIAAVFSEVCSPVVDDPQPYGTIRVASQDTLFNISCKPQTYSGMLLTDDQNPLLFYVQVLNEEVR